MKTLPCTLVCIAVSAFSLLGCAVDSEPDSASDGAFVTGTECKAVSDPPDVCPVDLTPVCGCDGKSYFNECSASRVVTSWTPGRCEDACERPHSKMGGVCPAVIDPVCGCDGNTYDNQCEALRVVQSVTKGECSSQGKEDACRLATPGGGKCMAVINYVCGCDGNTYKNGCEAERFVKSWAPGKC